MMDIKILRRAIHLLPEPGPEAAGLILDEVERLQAQRDDMLAVLEEIDECAVYCLDYAAPEGLHDRIKAAIKQGRDE